MFSDLTVDLRPGIGLGMFELGRSLWSILELLRGHQLLFPQVEVKYDPDASSTTPILLHIRPHLDLLFSGKGQRLKIISLRRLRDQNPSIIVLYNDTIISSAETILRRVNVSRMFGPTYAGEDIRYPGVRFIVDADIMGGRLEDRMQEVKRIVICQKETEGDDALGEVVECPAMVGEIASVVAKVHHGITAYFYPAGSQPLNVTLGRTTAQDLALELGAPLRTHYKEDTRMSIHATTRNAENIAKSDYFYNYFQYGMDFLISGNSHTVEKIILYSNVPGSPLFQRYHRCNWEIQGKPEDDEDDTPPRKRLSDKFETINHFLSPKDTPPSMVLDRTDEEDNMTLPSPRARLYGYDGVILEVSESSEVLSVTLF